MNDFRNKLAAEVLGFNFKLLLRNRGLLRGQASTPDPLVLLCPLLNYCFWYYTLPPYMKIFGSVGHQFGKSAPPPPPTPTKTTTTKRGGGGGGNRDTQVWFQTYLGIWFAGVCIFPEV